MRRVSALIALVVVLLSVACSGRKGIEEAARQMTGGEPARGKESMRKYGCNTCHTIPGVYGANAVVGPPLTSFRDRVYIAGRMPNTANNLVTWIRNPRGTVEHTAMPNMGVTEQDARDIAAYLYTLK